MNGWKGGGKGEGRRERKGREGREGKGRENHTKKEVRLHTRVANQSLCKKVSLGRNTRFFSYLAGVPLRQCQVAQDQGAGGSGPWIWIGFCWESIWLRTAAMLQDNLVRRAASCRGWMCWLSLLYRSLLLL